jgi:hypothetical protein
MGLIKDPELCYFMCQELNFDTRYIPERLIKSVKTDTYYKNVF